MILNTSPNNNSDEILSNNSICGVFTAFNPDADFEKNVSIVSAQLKHIIIVDNSPNPRDMFVGQENIDVIKNRVNLGIAKALNIALESAISKKYKWAITFDQDTIAHEGIVAKLIDIAKRIDKYSKLAVLGSNYINKISRGPGLPDYRPDNDYIEPNTVITAGSLMNLDIFKEIGEFREDFFIDNVDDEYCLRARKHGFYIYRTSEPLMDHIIGNPMQQELLGRKPHSMNAPPFRYYYMTRNIIIMARLYGKFDKPWLIAALKTIGFHFTLALVTEPDKLKKVKMISKGIFDATFNRMGMRVTP